MHIKRLGVRAFLAKVGTGFAAKNATDKDLAFLAKVGSSFNVLLLRYLRSLLMSYRLSAT